MWVDYAILLNRAQVTTACADILAAVEDDWRDTMRKQFEGCEVSGRTRAHDDNTFPRVGTKAAVDLASYHRRFFVDERIYDKSHHRKS